MTVDSATAYIVSQSNDENMGSEVSIIPHVLSYESNSPREILNGGTCRPGTCTM